MVSAKARREEKAMAAFGASSASSRWNVTTLTTREYFTVDLRGRGRR
jgi:hypothetical protein